MMRLLPFGATLLLAAPLAAFEPAPPAPAGQAVLYLYRIGVPPELRKTEYHVDGDLRVELKDDSYAWLYVGEGSHAVEAEWGMMASAPGFKFVFYAEPGEEYYYQQTGSQRALGLRDVETFSGIRAVARDEALKQLSGLKTLSRTLEPEPEKPTGVFEEGPPPPPGYGLLYFYRPSNPLGGKCAILVDGKELVKVPNKGYAWAHVKAGTRRIQTCRLGGAPGADVRYEVAHEKTSYFRLTGTLTPRRYTSLFSPVTASLALKELARIKKRARGSPAD